MADKHTGRTGSLFLRGKPKKNKNIKHNKKVTLKKKGFVATR